MDLIDEWIMKVEGLYKNQADKRNETFDNLILRHPLRTIVIVILLLILKVLIW